MRFATLASLTTAGVLWLALGSAPVQSQADDKAAPCETCGQSSATCPRCAAGKDCPHCKGDQVCPHCAKGKNCKYCGPHGPYGKWGAHKWDYKCVRPAKKPAEMTKQFKGLGDDGWRLVEADGGIWCFSKMQRPE